MRGVRIWAKQVQKVRTTHSTFVFTCVERAISLRSVACRRQCNQKSPWGKNQNGRERPHFFGFQTPKRIVGSLPPKRLGSVAVFCARGQRGLPGKTNEVIFSIGDSLVDHTDHELTYYPFRRTQLSAVDADFLHRAGGASSFLHALLESRGEERFTPGLHGTLHWSLHPRAPGKARQVNPLDVLKTVGLREGWHDVRAGATPPFDARCVTVAVWSLPPSQEIRGRVLRARIHRPQNLSDKKCDNFHENERRSPLSILKSPPKQPKAVTIQARVEESVKTQLELYAEFIDASPSYVITEALKLLCRKDDDFRRWADLQANNHNNEKAKGDVLAKAV